MIAFSDALWIQISKSTLFDNNILSCGSTRNVVEENRKEVCGVERQRSACDLHVTTYVFGGWYLFDCFLVRKRTKMAYVDWNKEAED